MTLAELTVVWRRRAEVLARYGAEGPAQAVRQCAEELDGQLHEWMEERLTLQQASRESGFSADHLGRLLREGKLPNAGRPNAPRIRRQDLPRKVAAEGRGDDLGLRMLRGA